MKSTLKENTEKPSKEIIDQFKEEVKELKKLFKAEDKYYYELRKKADKLYQYANQKMYWRNKKGSLVVASVTIDRIIEWLDEMR